MKKIIFLFLVCASLHNISNAQKTKSFDVFRNASITILGNISYYGDNPKDTTYMAIARDRRYEYIIQMVTIKVDTSLNSMFTFFTNAKDFLQKEDDGVKDGNLSVVKLLGIKQLWIYGKGGGYSTFSSVQIDKITTGIRNWGIKNRVAINQ